MLVVEPRHEINQWIAEHGGGKCWPESYTALGWLRKGELVAGLTFYDCVPGRNALCNVAIKGGIFPPSLLRAGFIYAFGQLGLPRLTFLIESDNLPSIRLVEALGAVQEGRMANAGRNSDLCIFALIAKDCRFWRRYNGKIRRNS